MGGPHRAEEHLWPCPHLPTCAGLGRAPALLTPSPKVACAGSSSCPLMPAFPYPVSQNSSAVGGRLGPARLIALVGAAQLMATECPVPSSQNSPQQGTHKCPQLPSAAAQAQHCPAFTNCPWYLFNLVIGSALVEPQ